MDCSGGDVKDEETGFARKAEALTRVMGNEVRIPPSGPELVSFYADADTSITFACTRVGEQRITPEQLLFSQELCLSVRWLQSTCSSPKQQA